VQGLGLLLLLAATGYGVRVVSLRRARVRVAELEREQALDRERSRIARDLHDDLGSRLAQIALIADSPSASAATDRIAGVARTAMVTLDELVWSVTARNDTVESFADYAAEFAEEHLSLAGVRCRLQFQEDFGGRQLGAERRRHLFLAFKEAIHNIVKHAGATEVRISLAERDGTLVVEVADNGRGLPAGGASATGNGLRNMRERMAAAGGACHIESRPEGGTRIELSAPVAG
jgi:signal transduction histidine kinase